MTEEELLALVAEVSPFIVVNGELDSRALINLCKDIERNARSKATASIFAVANAVSNNVDVKQALR